MTTCGIRKCDNKEKLAPGTINLVSHPKPGSPDPVPRQTAADPHVVNPLDLQGLKT